MRIPDYRVWVKKEKKMYGIEYDGYVDYIRACGEPDALGTDVQIIDETGTYQSYSFDEVEVMEYTGRKDKNGIKIYEGDVLYYRLLEQNYLVQWDNHNAKFSAVGGRNTFDSNAYRASAFDQMEIVGNVYENPNLMEGK